MNLFAGNLTFEGKKEIGELEFETLVTQSETGDSIVFILGEIDTDSEQELKDFLLETFGEWKCIDVSFGGVDRIEMFSEGYDEGVYEMVSFEGKQIDFDEICERFGEVDSVMVIREAEVSQLYGNRVVRVEFIY